MYRSGVCSWILPNKWLVNFISVMKYYDLCSLRGHFNWWFDAITVPIIPLWYIMLTMMRMEKGDWQYLSTE